MGQKLVNGKLKQAGDLLKRLEKINKFERKYHVLPPGVSHKLCEEMSNLAGNMPKISNPKTEEQLFLKEAKRRISGEAAYLDQRLSGKTYEFKTVLGILGIPEQDVRSLHPWLKRNKQKTIEAVDRLCEAQSMEEIESPRRLDIPRIRRETEEVTGSHIYRYHKVLGRFLEELSNVGGYLRDIEAAPTTKDRSYFSPLDNLLALSIPEICFSGNQGVLQFSDRKLIRLYGHEGMGHSLNKVITKTSSLPDFLKIDSALTVASEESLAQFYEDRVLEDLKKAPETQKKLGIEHRFKEIYQEAKDTEQLDNYINYIAHYAITVLADKSFGPLNDSAAIKRRLAVLDKVTINLGEARGFLINHSNRENSDEDGNLNVCLVSELRYCAKPVVRAFKQFNSKGLRYQGKGRSLIDTTLLSGFWTPQGLVERAKFVAANYKSGD